MAESMGFTLDTYDCQSIVIALICNNASTLKENQARVNKLIDYFASVNGQMTEENNYTAKITVTFG